MRFVIGDNRVQVLACGLLGAVNFRQNRRGYLMSIDLSEFRQPSRTAQCRVKTAIETLAEGATLEAALAEADITTASICAWLKRRDFEIGTTTIARHRKRGCSCS